MPATARDQEAFKARSRANIEFRSCTRVLTKRFPVERGPDDTARGIDDLSNIYETLQKLEKYLKDGMVAKASFEPHEKPLRLCVEEMTQTEARLNTETSDGSANPPNGEQEKLLQITSIREAAESITKLLNADKEREAETRRNWQEAHPIEAQQETELSLYDEALKRSLLDCSGGKAMNQIPPAEWDKSEKCLLSLELYTREHKIRSERIRATKIDQTLKNLLKSFQELDQSGIRPETVDVQRAERVWGLVDKIGSGLSYLLKLDTIDGTLPAPTSRSVFLMKSAPPASFKFALSQNEYQEKKIMQVREKLTAVILDPKDPIVPEQESRWNSAYAELEDLEHLLQANDKGVERQIIQKTKIDETIQAICRRMESLHHTHAGSIGEESALMLVSWELALRIEERIVAKGA